MTFSLHGAQPGALLDHPELEAHLGRYDPELLTYTWTAADRKTDRLQARFAGVGQSVAAGEPIATMFSRVRAAANEAAGRADGPARGPEPVLCGSVEGRPGSPSRGSAERSPPRASLALSRFARATGAV